MAIYKNITTDDSTVTTISGGGTGSGSVKFIKITNKSNSLSTLVTIYLRDFKTNGNPTYDIVKTLMPPQTNLVLDDQLMLVYDGKQFDMRLATTTSGGNADLSIIIK